MAKERGYTLKQIFMDHMCRLKPKDFTKKESFVLETNPKLTLGFATVLYSTFVTFDNNALAAVIFAFLKKWPQNKSHSDLLEAAMILVYVEHYEHFHNQKLPQSLIDRKDKAVSILVLKDTKYEYVQEENGKKIRKTKNYGDELSIKLRSMNMEDIFAWEIELGVDPKRIEKQKELCGKSKGLAMMSISNAIRKVLKTD